MKNTRKKFTESQWENRTLGATEKFARKASKKHEEKLDDKLGLQSISIRLQKNLIDDLKEIAKEDGLGYQPYIRQILTQHVRNEIKRPNKHLRIIAHKNY